MTKEEDTDLAHTILHMALERLEECNADKRSIEYKAVAHTICVASLMLKDAVLTIAEGMKMDEDRVCSIVLHSVIDIIGNLYTANGNMALCFVPEKK